jgi:hypothetical protein
VAGGVQIGTASKTVRTDKGSADVWWCQYTNVDTPPGKVNWRAQYVIDLTECHDLTALAAAIGRIAASPSYATVENELRAASTGCVVQPGTQRHYEAMRLRYLGCQELVKPPLVPNFDAPLPADWCGPVPTPPSAPAEVWWVAKAPSNANPPGTRPAYHYTGGVFVNSQQRVAEYTLCNPAIARIKIDYVTWCVIDGSTVLYAVAAKKP